MCRKVLQVYYFPLHYVSDIMIFYLNVFRSYHETLGSQRDLYTALVIIIGSISWSSKFVKSLWSHTTSHTQWYILCFRGIQGYRALFPAAPGNYDNLHGETTTRCTLPVHCTLCAICINIFLQLKFILEAYLRPHSTVPHIYLNTCFTAIQWVCLDWLMDWLGTFTA